MKACAPDQVLQADVHNSAMSGGASPTVRALRSRQRPHHLYGPCRTLLRDRSKPFHESPERLRERQQSPRWEPAPQSAPARRYLTVIQHLALPRRRSPKERVLTALHCTGCHLTASCVCIASSSCTGEAWCRQVWDQQPRSGQRGPPGTLARCCGFGETALVPSTPPHTASLY